MAHWLVTQGDRQFTAADLEELKKLAVEGRIGRGDMIQPPGASDWLYASELPELNGLLKASAVGLDDDLDIPRRGAPTGVIALLLLAIAAGGGYAMYHFGTGIQETNLNVLDEVSLSEMLVTAEGVSVRKDPDSGSSSVGSVEKNAKVTLLAKRRGFYRVKTSGGAEGWVGVDQVVPAYYFTDSETREDYDPLYNPDKYTFVKNAGWMLMPSERGQEGKVTNFTFLIQNKSKFDMEGIVLLATMKDESKKVLETKEIPIEGVLKRYENSMVGTLAPDPKADPEGEPRVMTEYTFKQMLKDDADLQLRWSDGVEVRVSAEGVAEASIDLLEVRAIPKKLD